MRRQSGMGLLTVLLGGCGTVDQVPLVYISTLKVGVSAETGTTASPGGKVIIGVDATDAAFVPVAVARTCRQAGGASNLCQNTAFPITEVHGANNISPVEFARAARAQTNQVRMDSENFVGMQRAVTAALIAQSQAKGADTQLTADKQTLAARHEELRRQSDAASSAGVAAADPQADPQVAYLAGAIARNEPLAANLTKANDDVATAQGKLVQAERQLNDSQRELAETLTRTPDAIGTRNDALSVFGSFDTNPHGGFEGDRPNAGLSLGKSFSTGVAAQLLTEGLSRGAAAKEVTQCLTMALGLANSAAAALHDQVLTDATKACQTRQN